MIERNIDYLAFSAPSSPSRFASDNYRPIRPVAFYKFGYQDENDIRYYFGNPKNPNLAHVVLSGSSLAYMRGKGYTDKSILEFAIEEKGKVSRLDLAVTKFVDDWFFTVGDVSAWFAEKWFAGALADRGAKTIARLVEDGGLALETLYIGDIKKRGKRGIFRAYDKGLEWDLEPFLITRLELEEKNENAHNTAMRIVEGESIAACFRSRLDCSAWEYQKAMDDAPAKIGRGQGKEKSEGDEKMDRRWEWLLSQVAPALKEAIASEKKKDTLALKLTAFLNASGLTGEMRDGAALLAYWKEMSDNEK